MRESLPPRLRYTVARYGPVLVVLLVAVGLLAGAWSYQAHTAPPVTTQTTDRVDRQTFATALNTSATVTGETVLYPRGATLTDQPVYLLGASPVLAVRTRTTVPAGEPATVNHTVTAELRARRSGETFWRTTRELASESVRVSDGEAVTTARLNVSQFAAEEIDRVRGAIGQVGTLDVRFVVTAQYSTATYDGQLNLTAPLSVGETAYSVDRPDPVERSHSQTVARTVTEPASPTPPAELRAALAALAVLGAGVVRRLHAESEDLDEIRAAVERARFADWISEGTLPADDRERVTVDSLSDLVDVAIDSQKRVIHDRVRSEYAVLDGDVRYGFEPGRPGDDFDWGGDHRSERASQETALGESAVTAVESAIDRTREIVDEASEEETDDESPARGEQTGGEDRREGDADR